MPEISITVEAYCDECGSPLASDVREYRGHYNVCVEPCESCVKNAYAEGKFDAEEASEE